jgi:hypothetical protein
MKIYVVPMFVNVLRMTPRVVMRMFFAVTLTLLVFAVAAMSLLSLTLAIQGWATNPPTTNNAPAHL